MAKQNGRDYIYLVWKEPVKRRQYTVAKLSKNGKYEFEYDIDIESALKEGFEPLIAFKDINKKYESDRLFATFGSRVPDSRRKDIEKILDNYGLKEYDAYQLLKKSGGRSPIDDLEFIDPILDNEENPIERIFYVAGPRHYLGCEGTDCCKSLDIEVGEELFLEREPNNIKDNNAIKIMNAKNELVGYVPRYYNSELLNLIDKGAKYKIKVHEVNKEKNCNECLRAYLKIEVINKNK